MKQPLNYEEIPGEIWLKAPGFDGYMVSNFGRVMSVLRKPRLMRFDTDKDGYLKVCLRKNNKPVNVIVSRIVCEAFNGPSCDQSNVCCHNDGDKRNNKHDNLRWDTQLGNIKDKKIHGTHQIGSKHGAATITEDIAIKIKRELIAYKKTRGKLLHVSNIFNVSFNIVADISRGKTWRHV